jgi:hypothetical protein
MANRSDFDSAFPRYLKRIWTMTDYKDAHEAGEAKRLFIEAHKAHKTFKNTKRDLSKEVVSEVPSV